MVWIGDDLVDLISVVLWCVWCKLLLIFSRAFASYACAIRVMCRSRSSVLSLVVGVFDWDCEIFLVYEL